MINAEHLKSVGIDYAAGLKRFLNNNELYEAILTAFVNGNVLERAQTAFEHGDKPTLMAAIHEAKGACGNAALTNIYEEAKALHLQLCEGSCTEAELAAHFQRFTFLYTAVREGIKKALNA